VKSNKKQKKKQRTSVGYMFGLRVHLQRIQVKFVLTNDNQTQNNGDKMQKI